MSDVLQAALSIVSQQVKELDSIVAKTNQDLNIVAGKEQIAKWKARTVPLLDQHLGATYAQGFSNTLPGPSFTNDLLEEFGDEAEVYRTALEDMVKEYKKKHLTS